MRRPPHRPMCLRISWLLPGIRCEAACRHFLGIHIVECESKCLGLFLCLRFSKGIEKCLASTLLSLFASVPAAASSRECPSVSTSAFASTSSGVSPVVCVPCSWPLHRQMCHCVCRLPLMLASLSTKPSVPYRELLSQESRP